MYCGWCMAVKWRIKYKGCRICCFEWMEGTSTLLFIIDVSSRIQSTRLLCATCLYGPYSTSRFHWHPAVCLLISPRRLGDNMMTSSNGNNFRVTGPLWGEFISHRWIPLTKASDAELWYFLWSGTGQTVGSTNEAPVIWDTMAPIITSLEYKRRKGSTQTNIRFLWH